MHDDDWKLRGLTPYRPYPMLRQVLYRDVEAWACPVMETHVHGLPHFWYQPSVVVLAEPDGGQLTEPDAVYHVIFT
jgi:hypothetical protein